MKTTRWTFLVSDPLAFLPRLEELRFQLTRWRCREAEMIAVGEVKSEWFHTILRRGDVTVTLAEYPFARFLTIEGVAGQVHATTSALGFRKADVVGETVEVLFSRWRARRGLRPSPHLRFDDYYR